MAHGKGRHYAFYKLMLRNYRKMLLLILPVALVLATLIVFVMRGRYADARRQSELICEKLTTTMEAELMDLRRIANVLTGNKEIRVMTRQKVTALSRQHMQRVSNIIKSLSREIEGNTLCSDGILYFDASKYFVDRSAAWTYETEAKGYYAMLPQMMLTMYGADEKWHQERGNLFYLKALLGGEEGGSAVLLMMDAASVTSALSDNILESNMHAYWLDGDKILGASNFQDAEQNIRTLYPNIPTETGAFRQNGRQYYVTWSNATLEGWRNALVSDWNQFSAVWRTYLGIAILFSCVFVCLCLVVAYWIARSSCKPFDIIVKLLENPAEISEMDYISHYKEYDELGMISALVHQTKYQYVALQNTLTAKESLLTEAQNAALQSQMNPHFLFNTLETVNWMAVEQLSQENSISYVITRLAALLRTSMQVDHSLIQIKRELENAKTYLDIQQMRYPDQFDVEWDVDASLIHYATICLSIQPLLENAIKHGMVRERRGKIRIRCVELGDMICFEVIDDGAGIEAAKLKQLQSTMREKCFARGNRIGLYNLNMRIQLLFGEEYYLEIESVPNVRTCIRMRIPKMIA